jgi:GTPase Era involved in 16S rRNA processing
MEVLSEKIDNLGDVNDLRTRVTALEKQNKLLATVIIANKENLNGLSDIIKAVIQEHLNEMLTNMENLNGLSDIIKNFIQEHYLNELKSDIPDATAL